MEDQLAFHIKLHQILTLEPSDEKSSQLVNHLQSLNSDFEWLMTDTTALHLAAKTNDLLALQTLIDYGHPWHAVDASGKCAGEYLEKGSEAYNYLLEVGVRQEMILNAMGIGGGVLDENKFEEIEEMISDHNDYLKSEVTYTEDALIDCENNGVMMDWERPLMKRHAAVIMKSTFIEPELELMIDNATNIIDYNQLLSQPESLLNFKNDGKLFVTLNVGFGMGIIDAYINAHLQQKIKDGYECIQYIIEAHPSVLAKMKENGWKTSQESSMFHLKLIVLEGDWKDCVPGLLSEGIRFDAIFFDTFGESYDQLAQFHSHVPQLLRSPKSTYSFFNGLGASTNTFFYDVYCEIVKLDLLELGIKLEYEVMNVEQDQCIWKELKRSYFSCPMYFLPKCRMTEFK